MERDQEVLEYVVKVLVDHPESIKVTRTIDERGVLLLLDVHPEDMGKVIGKEGHTAKAIRTILRVVGIKNGARVNLKINEPEGSTRPTMADYKRDPAPTPAMKTVDEAMADLNL
jgi:uncharacterized protein